MVKTSQNILVENNIPQVIRTVALAYKCQVTDLRPEHFDDVYNRTPYITCNYTRSIFLLALTYMIQLNNKISANKQCSFTSRTTANRRVDAFIYYLNQFTDESIELSEEPHDILTRDRTEEVMRCYGKMYRKGMQHDIKTQDTVLYDDSGLTTISCLEME